MNNNQKNSNNNLSMGNSINNGAMNNNNQQLGPTEKLGLRYDSDEDKGNSSIFHCLTLSLQFYSFR